MEICWWCADQIIFARYRYDHVPICTTSRYTGLPAVPLLDLVSDNPLSQQLFLLPTFFVAKRKLRPAYRDSKLLCQKINFIQVRRCHRSPSSRCRADCGFRHEKIPEICRWSPKRAKLSSVHVWDHRSLKVWRTGWAEWTNESQPHAYNEAG